MKIQDSLIFSAIFFAISCGAVILMTDEPSERPEVELMHSARIVVALEQQKPCTADCLQQLQRHRKLFQTHLSTLMSRSGTALDPCDAVSRLRGNILSGAPGDKETCLQAAVLIQAANGGRS